MNFKINLSQCCSKNKSANCKGKENKFFSYLNSFKALLGELNINA